ncbi:MAG: caspase family protein, partial [Saprospiraceae bacterium]|nr:caspase family protein [Saprospiraceae bacterium]
QFLKGHTGPVQAVAFSPVSPLMLTGSNDNTAKLWDLNLKAVQTFTGHTDAVFHVSISTDGKFVLTASGDGTAKLWNPETGKCLHTFQVDQPADFVFSPDGKYLLHLNLDNTIHFYDAQNTNLLATMAILNEKDWVITTPSGLFDASPGAMELMYFISGDEVIELEQLKERYYEPGLIAKVMGFVSGELRDVQQFKDLPLYPLVEASINQNRLDIQLEKRNGGLGKLSFFVNGKEVAEDINSGRKESLSLELKEFAKYYRTDTLNTLSLRAYNAEGWLKSQAFSFPYAYVAARGSGQGSAPTLGNGKPRLFAIIVGTADYSGEKLDLKYADQDATSIAAALNAAGQQLFGNDVQLKLLSTKSNVSAELAGSVQSDISTKANIKAAFDAFAQQAQPTDVLVLYFSGHGITYGEAEKAQFYYLTKDIASEDLSDPEIRSKLTISSNELTDWIKGIAAQKQVLILDACNSGKIVETLSTIGKKDLNPSQVRALDRMKDRTGMFILTGSAANMVSYEASQFGQGLLTYSLLQGMSGLALTDDKRVDVMTLFQYSRDKVPELAKSINGVQIPTLAFPVGGGSFDIGIVNDKVKIPLSQAKPVFIRNNFQDEDAFEDVLGLTDALEQYFRQQTAKGVQSKLIYVDVKEYENAFSMKGRYKVTGNEVAVRVRLYKGKSALGDELKVNGKKDDMPGLVKQILQAVMPLAK